MRSMEWIQLTGYILHGSICLWWVMNKSSVSSAQRSYVFSDSVLCIGKIHENPRANTAWEDKLMWFKSFTGLLELWDTIDGEPMVFEWNIIPGFTTLQLSEEVKSLLLRLSVNTREFLQDGWPGGWGPQGRSRKQAAADSRGSRICVRAKHLTVRVAPQEREGWINILPR